MNHEEVDSSNIASIGHDPRTSTLEVKFHKGGMFRFSGVSVEKHKTLMAADSVGKHFREHIKDGNHECTKCEEDEE